MKNNIPIFGILMLILIILRFLFNDNPQLIAVVASINLAALLIVLFSLTTRIKERGIKKIERMGTVKHFVSRSCKQFRLLIDCGIYIPYGVASIIYLLCFKCELGNDVISIIALCLSLSDEYIVATIMDFL